MTGPATVSIVHCVDAEGPLHESLGARFERLRDLYGITGIEPTPENLGRLHRGEIPLGGGLERQVSLTLSGHLTTYHDTWDKVDAMLDRVMNADFRARVPDSFGGAWVFNWFCLDHVGFDYNPRRRDIGYHNVFDHYREALRVREAGHDAIHWHFHPMSTYRDAHRCATSYVNSPELHQILCRRIVERAWFPSVFRAGFQTERPDSHWFLEQWIPFDVSNMAMEDPSEFDRSLDFRKGRSGDWRRAPADWSVYHPSHDDYQRPGHCRRWIGRALNVLNRIASIDQREMDKAFAAAAAGRPVLVGIASHDFRDLGTEVDFLRELIVASSRRYPDVRFKYCEAREAFRATIWPDGLPEEPALDLDVILHDSPVDDVPHLEVVSTRGRVFGPQPFLAIETRGRRYIHDNFDFAPSLDRWYYAFHPDTLPLDDVARLGVAANDRFGNAVVKVVDVKSVTG
jgi:hypothetical protein